MADGEHLRALIAERKDEGWSYRRIARQAGLGATFVSNLAKRPRKGAPKPEELQALARGLQMPEQRIFDAANRDWTTPPRLIEAQDDSGAKLIIASQLEELPESSVQLVKDLTDTLYRRMKEEERRRANG